MDNRFFLLLVILLSACMGEQKPSSSDSPTTEEQEEHTPLDWVTVVRQTCDTTYANTHPENIDLPQDTVDFPVASLLVSEGKLWLLDDSLDQSVVYSLPGEVLTATWSPWEENEVFVLMKTATVLSKAGQEFYENDYRDPPSDALLYRISITNRTCEGITRIVNHDFTFDSLQMELWGTFARDTRLYADPNRSTLHFHGVHLNLNGDPMEIDTMTTFTVDLDRDQTTVTPYTGQRIALANQHQLPIVDPFRTAPIYSATFGADSVSIHSIKGASASFSLDRNMFDSTRTWDIHLPSIAADSSITNPPFSFVFLSDNTLLGSVYLEGDMMMRHGRIEWIDLNTRAYQQVLDYHVIGQDAFVYQLPNGLVVIKTLFCPEHDCENTRGTHVYGPDMTLRRSFTEVQHLEFKPQSRE